MSPVNQSRSESSPRPIDELFRWLSEHLAARARRFDPASSIEEFLPVICEASGATASILWAPEGEGYRWQWSQGIEISDAAQASDFTSDIVANVATVFQSGVADIFIAPSEEPRLHGQDEVPDPLIRELVMYHRQLFVPLRGKCDKPIAVISLFQLTELPEDRLWTLDDLNQLQDQLECLNRSQPEASASASKTASCAPEPVLPEQASSFAKESVAAKPLQTREPGIDDSAGQREVHNAAFTSNESDEHRSSRAQRNLPGELQTDASLHEDFEGQAEGWLSRGMKSLQRFLADKSHMLRAWPRQIYRYKVVSLALIVTVVIASLSVIPAERSLRCEGVLQPVNRSKVHAPADGFVKQAFVSIGQSVQQGDVLLTLTSSDLSAEITAHEIKLDATRQKLRTCRLHKLSNRFDDDQQRQTNSRELAALDKTLRDLQASYDQLLEKRSTRNITSPIAGRVVRIELPQSLDSRPVRQGQELLTIADPHGPWELELMLDKDRIPDLVDTPRAGGESHVDTSEKSSPSEGLKTSYILASHPTTIRQGVVREIANDANAVLVQAGMARVYVDIDSQAKDLQVLKHPGTQVIARIHTHQNSGSYSKLNELIDWAKRLWF